MREDKIVSPALRLAARTLSPAEVCWRHSDIIAVLKELAERNSVILGFDILAFEAPDNGIRPWGTSAYQVDQYLRSRPWNECVKISLEAALKDVERSRELTGYNGDLDDLWYCPVTRSWGEASSPQTPLN